MPSPQPRPTQAAAPPLAPVARSASAQGAQATPTHKAKHRSDGHRPWLTPLLRALVSRGMLLFFYRLCRGRVVDLAGVERLDHGFVIVANHVSYMDWILLWGLFRYRYGIQLTFLAKERLFRHWFWGKLVTCSCCVRVADDGQSVASLSDYKRLKQARHIAIFPEGTRSRDGRLGPFKPGAAQLAKRLGLPIVPVALNGLYQVWPAERTLPRPAPCELVIGAPLPTDAHESEAALTERLRQAVARLAR